MSTGPLATLPGRTTQRPTEREKHRGETDRLWGNRRDRTARLVERAGAGLRRHGLRAVSAQDRADRRLARHPAMSWKALPHARLHDSPASNNVTATNTGKMGRIARADLAAFLEPPLPGDPAASPRTTTRSGIRYSSSRQRRGTALLRHSGYGAYWTFPDSKQLAASAVETAAEIAVPEPNPMLAQHADQRLGERLICVRMRDEDLGRHLRAAPAEAEAWLRSASAIGLTSGSPISGFGRSTHFSFQTIQGISFLAAFSKRKTGRTSPSATSTSCSDSRRSCTRYAGTA